MPSSRHVHHKNQVKTDDSPCNLLSVDSINHFRLHHKLWQDGLRNPAKRPLQVQKIVEQAKNYNHAIVSIEKLPPEPVYNFTVDRLHNYPLSCGVVSSNCITGAIGIGKSSISMIGVLYDLYRVTLLKNPHKKYKLLPTTPIVITLITATMDLAGAVLADQLIDAIGQSPYFRSKLLPGKGDRIDEDMFPDRKSTRLNSSH